jgi:hypothetical protein
LAPTILSLASCDNFENNHGISLNLEDWNSTVLNQRKELYFHHYDFPGSLMIAKHYGIRTPAYKLTHYYQFGEWELFDIRSEQAESKNIFDSFNEVEKLKKVSLNSSHGLVIKVTNQSCQKKWRRIYRGPSARVE